MLSHYEGLLRNCFGWNLHDPGTTSWPSPSCITLWDPVDQKKPSNGCHRELVTPILVWPIILFSPAVRGIRKNSLNDENVWVFIVYQWTTLKLICMMHRIQHPFSHVILLPRWLFWSVHKLNRQSAAPQVMPCYTTLCFDGLHFFTLRLIIQTVLDCLYSEAVYKVLKHERYAQTAKDIQSGWK